MAVLITPEQRALLLANGIASDADRDFDPRPVVKLFTPDAGCTWLLCGIEPDRPGVAWGLCDLGLGCPEIGTVSLDTVAMVRGRLGLRVEQDPHFTATKPVSAYARDAQRAGMVVTG